MPHKNFEDARASRRRWYAKNRKKMRAYNRRWRASHAANESKRAHRWRSLNRKKASSASLRWQSRNPEKVQDARLRRKYKISESDYQRMLQMQAGLCDICKRPPASGQRLSVDHDHTTGKVRGLLHGNCNSAIGLLNDDPFRVEQALRYLLKHQEK